MEGILLILAILAGVGWKLGITSKERLYLAILQYVAGPLVCWALKKGMKYFPEEAKSMASKLVIGMAMTADPEPEAEPEPADEPVKKTTTTRAKK